MEEAEDKSAGRIKDLEGQVKQLEQRVDALCETEERHKANAG